jgi:hypothetical protein
MRNTHTSSLGNGVVQIAHFGLAAAGVVSEISDISGFRLSPRWYFSF